MIRRYFILVLFTPSVFIYLFFFRRYGYPLSKVKKVFYTFVLIPSKAIDDKSKFNVSWNVNLMTILPYDD